MGMYDSFYAKIVCPYCGTKREFEFQTKVLACSLSSFRIGDEVSIRDLEIEGIIVKNRDIPITSFCESLKCRKKPYNLRQVAAIIKIRNGKFSGVASIKKERVKMRKANKTKATFKFIEKSSYAEYKKAYKRVVKTLLEDKETEDYIKLLLARKTIIEKEVINIPDRDGKGPRKRSPRPSVKKGGLKKGKCK